MPFCSVHSPFKSYKNGTFVLFNYRRFLTFSRGSKGRNHTRGETKLPSKMVLIHFVKDFCFKCFIEHLQNFRSAIRGCYLLYFIQKSPLIIFKRRCNLFQMADSYFWSETLQTARDEFSLNRFEPTSLTEWEECVIVAGKALPQLVKCTIFPTGLRQFLPQGGHLRALGIVHYDHIDVPTWYFSQPICAIHAPG